jgi:hypothetical protein
MESNRAWGKGRSTICGKRRTIQFENSIGIFANFSETQKSEIPRGELAVSLSKLNLFS